MINDVKYGVEAGFFDAINEDRRYSADDMNRPYKKLISNGVLPKPKGETIDYLKVVSADSGMNVIVNLGYAFIGDKWFENPSNLIITISPNTEILSRIDSIIAQVDKTQAGRAGNIVYRKGTASSSPEHPPINTEEDVIEYRLADILVSPSCVEITEDLITDYRGGTECPWSASIFNAQVSLKRYKLTLTEPLEDNARITIPASYRYNSDTLQVYFEGELLEKGIHYDEVETSTGITNKIQIKDWGESIEAGYTFSFIITEEV